MSSSSEEEFEFDGGESKPSATAVVSGEKTKRKRPTDDSPASDEDDDDDLKLSSLKTKQKPKKLKIRISRKAAKKAKLEESEAEEEPDAEDDDDDFDEPKPEKTASSNKEKKAKKSKAKAAKAKPIPVKSSSSKTKVKKSSAQQRELKKLDRQERLTYAMQSFLWWDAVDPPAGCQWVTMEHAGVAFPEPYQPHGIKMLYDGEPVTLTPEQEEAATFFAATDPDGMHLGNPTTAKIFIKNFFDDFRQILGKKHVIQKFEKCDFAPMRSHLEEQKIIRKAATDLERKTVKEDKSQALLKYGYAIVDGHLERVGNFNMEPPGTFRGRGVHPKMGKLKSRVSPEQVSLNLSECAPIPICHVPGHAWGDIRHDPRGQWLATWKENINNQVSQCDIFDSYG